MDSVVAIKAQISTAFRKESRASHQLERLRGRIERPPAETEDAVLACSALKQKHDVNSVFLPGDYGLIEKQLRSHHGHFMSAALLRSQFDDLEEPQPNEVRLQSSCAALREIW